MRELGRRLAGLLRAGDLVVLSGPLGAGKTTLTQGLGDGLKVRGPITSPTFVIARVHPSLAGGPPLVHADAYRLGGLDELDDLDLDRQGAVTVVEWGEGLAEGLSEDRLGDRHRARRDRGAYGHADRRGPAMGEPRRPVALIPGLFPEVPSRFRGAQRPVTRAHRPVAGAHRPAVGGPKASSLTWSPTVVSWGHGSNDDLAVLLPHESHVSGK